MADYLKIAQLALARTTVALVSTAHLPGTAAGNADDIEVAPYLPDCGFAIAVLDRARVRIMLLDGATIGVWSDLDGPEVRRALKAVGIGHLGTSMAPVLRSGTNVARWRVNLFRS
jgi:hypothetical protein